MASERERVIARLLETYDGVFLADKAYDAGYKAGMEAAARNVETMTGFNGLPRSVRESYAAAIRALAEGEEPQNFTITGNRFSRGAKP